MALIGTKNKIRTGDVTPLNPKPTTPSVWYRRCCVRQGYQSIGPYGSWWFPRVVRIAPPQKEFKIVFVLRVQPQTSHAVCVKRCTHSHEIDERARLYPGDGVDGHRLTVIFNVSQRKHAIQPHGHPCERYYKSSVVACTHTPAMHTNRCSRRTVSQTHHLKN